MNNKHQQLSLFEVEKQETQPQPSFSLIWRVKKKTFSTTYNTLDDVKKHFDRCRADWSESIVVGFDGTKRVCFLGEQLEKS